MKSPVGRCRVCRRRVYWVTLPSGKRAALDLQPSADEGDTLIVPIGPGATVTRLGITIRDEDLREDLARFVELRMIHFKSSPSCAPDWVPPRERADLA